jgi:predicted nucleic acid-binding Zn ribbon protein
LQRTAAVAAAAERRGVVPIDAVVARPSAARRTAALQSAMPTYVYVVINDDGSEGETFEVFQKMSDPALETHPETGEPVRRVPVAPHIAGEWSDSATKQKLSDKNLDRLGFTKYERAGGGHFEKKAGKGPNVIGAD